MLKVQIAQLRHAYMQLNNEQVRNQKQFAEGLISPIIERLEEIQREMDDESSSFWRTRL